MPIKGLIYDLDGTVTITTPVAVKSMALTLEKLKINLDPAKLKPLIHLSIDDMLKQMFKDHKEYIPKVKVTWFKYFIDLAFNKGELKLAKNIKKTLIKLKNMGYKLAIGTGTLRVLMEMTIERFNLDRFFDAFVAFDDVENPKPAPDTFIVAAEKINIAPKNCLVVGDSTFDVIGARQAGCITVFYFHEYDEHKEGEIEKVNPDFVIHDHLEILDILNEVQKM